MSQMLDPVCDMIVNLEEQRERGLTLEMADREYAFCAAGCMSAFAKAPATYRAKVDAWLADGARGEHHAHGGEGEAPAIDAGMRAWYKSCRCCLSDAYPEVVAQLDAEQPAQTSDPLPPSA